MSKFESMIFDVDGTLVKADDKIRVEKYRVLFKHAMKLVQSKEYEGCVWLFDQLTDMYDEGVDISSKYYELINQDTPKILSELSKKYKLFYTSWANKDITIKKLKATGIYEYFDDWIDSADYEGAIAVDDRPKDFLDAFFVKFEHGQYKGSKCEADKYIDNLEELLLL